MTTTKQTLSQLEEYWQRARKRPVIVNPAEIEPGIYPNMPFDMYCRIPAVNNSSLSALRTSPMHYRYSPPVDETPSMRLGTFVHAGQLEPHLLDTHYVTIPDERFISETIAESDKEVKSPRSTKLYKEKVKDFLKLHPNKTAISGPEFEKLAGILKQLKVHKLTKKLFGGKTGVAEVTLVWVEHLPQDDGTVVELKCKGRVDYHTTAPLSRHDKTSKSVDLKTTQDIFWFNIGERSYHRQMAFYQRGWNQAWEQSTDDKVRKTFPAQLDQMYIAAVETKRPYAVRAAPIDSEDLLLGHKEAEWCLGVIGECTYNRRWPGPDDPDTWQLTGNYYPINSHLPLSAIRSTTR